MAGVRVSRQAGLDLNHSPVKGIVPPTVRRFRRIRFLVKRNFQNFLAVFMTPHLIHRCGPNFSFY